MTAEAEAALRTLLAELARAQVLRVQVPGVDVVAVMREAQHAVSALQLVAEFLCADDVAEVRP